MDDNMIGVEDKWAVITVGTAEDVVLELVAGKEDGIGRSPCCPGQGRLGRDREVLLQLSSSF